jgi:hypothetical protein
MHVLRKTAVLLMQKNRTKKEPKAKGEKSRTGESYLCYLQQLLS